MFTEEIDYWEDKILSWSDQWGLDPNLVATVMQIESCGNPRALSSAGAAGLFQVMPYHFQAGEDPFHPGLNARRGLAYLKQSLTKGESSKLALAGYNGGIHGASRPESTWPAETQRYVYWGEKIYQDALAGKKHSSRLDEWLSAGGSTLCSQAARQQRR
ncbi:MAG: lytic transglycosylase domain-containing protein [Anaerolineales bacterium]|nr:lytic transglycosylase domain-containing protein [Anaerolineales bacterium]